MRICSKCLTDVKIQCMDGCHNEMNREHFMARLQEKLTPNLTPRCVLVLDNASHHNVQIHPATPSNSTRRLAQWQKYTVQFYCVEMRPVRHRTFKACKLDSFLEQHGYSALRRWLSLLLLLCRGVWYQITWGNNPEDSHLQTRRRENLKCHSVLSLPPHRPELIPTGLEKNRVGSQNVPLRLHGVQNSLTNSMEQSPS
jgi:transposase